MEDLKQRLLSGEPYDALVKEAVRKRIEQLEAERDELKAMIENHQLCEKEPVAHRAWFDEDNGARWLFTLWPEEEKLDVAWEPLYRTAIAKGEKNA